MGDLSSTSSTRTFLVLASGAVRTDFNYKSAILGQSASVPDTKLDEALLLFRVLLAKEVSDAPLRLPFTVWRLCYTSFAMAFFRFTIQQTVEQLGAEDRLFALVDAMLIQGF